VITVCERDMGAELELRTLACQLMFVVRTVGTESFWTSRIRKKIGISMDPDLTPDPYPSIKRKKDNLG
jgi:hypothetical protein